MICNHKLGLVQPDGYQYCQICGLGIVAPCKHKFHFLTEMSITKDNIVIAKHCVLKCINCGEMKTYSVGIDKSGYI